MTLSETTKSDPVEDCHKIIDSAKKTIADRDRLIQDQDKAIRDLGISLETIEKDRDSNRNALNSWYHNPTILIPLSLLVGAGGILYLEHR